MFKNYLMTTLRILSKNKVFTFINIAGLALGMYVFIIIGLYVYDDFSYDKYHTNAGRIYRVVSFDNTRNWISAVTSGPLMLKIKEDVPEIEASTRISQFYIRLQPGNINPASDSLAIYRSALITGPGFFDVFDFKILEGEREKPLQNPNGVFISQNVANTIFPNESALGKPLNINLVENAYVAGIIETPPSTSHMQFDAVLFMDIRKNPAWWDSWENLSLTGFVLLREGADPKETEKKITASSRQGGFSEVFTPVLQPILDMHLKSADIRYDAFNQNKNNQHVVYGLILIAFLVLFVASINFVNLSVAKSIQRAKEVGLRKVVGANRSQLGFQFTVESLIISFIAMIIAVTAAETSLPYLSTLLNRPMNLNFIEQPNLAFLFFSISLIVGVLSGLYPASVLSSFKPVKVLGSKLRGERSSTRLRKVLVIGQFAVSIALISGVIIILQQIKYLEKTDFGYNRDNVLVIPASTANVTYTNDIFKERIRQIPGVSSVGRCSALPGNTLPTTEVCFDFRSTEVGSMFEHFRIDYDFIPVSEATIIKGRNFARDIASDSRAVLIKETAYKLSGWNDLEGKKIINRGESMTDETFNVIGVFKDIHFGQAKQVIEPMLLQLNPQASGFTLIRTMDGQTSVDNEVKEIYDEMYPDDNYVNYSFKDVFSYQFNGEKYFALSIAVFAGLAIIIACLGLFGLASYSIEVRRKELAIRKVLGSSVFSILLMLSSEFSKWVIIANLVAWPCTYFLMQNWLKEFAYKMSISLVPFLVAGVFVLIISLLTIGLEIFRVARTNPVDHLKCE